MLVKEFVDSRSFSLLKKQIEEKRYASTYLFTGPEQEKKQALAVAFAQRLNCELGHQSLNCTCKTCVRIARRIHPDVQWFGADQEASSIKISEVRDFQSTLALKPYEAKVKVFIFVDAERLTLEAQNALLKNLEEPPPGNVILLLVPRSASLLSTISSRAMEVRVPPFSVAELQALLVKEGVQPADARGAAEIAQGSLTHAREACEKGTLETRKRWGRELSEDPARFFGQFQNTSRQEVMGALDFAAGWIRDLVVFKTTRHDNLLFQESAPSLARAASHRTVDEILETLDQLLVLRKSVDRFTNVKLAITQAQILLEHFLKR